MDLVDFWVTFSQCFRDMRILFLARVTAGGLLKAVVPAEMQLALPKESISKDIKIWLETEIRQLFVRRILPQSAQQEAASLTDHLVKGADGMFLWARLMINFLRSPCMTSAQRLELIRQINVPEGLGDLYARIFLFIDNSGQVARSLATKTLGWTMHAITPLTSKQLHQAQVVDGCVQPTQQDLDVNEFEDTIVVACSGLVERSHPGFRFSHLSIKEFIQKSPEARSDSMVSRSLKFATTDIIPDPTIFKMQIAHCCLRQLLHHTPNSPLSGQLNCDLTAAQLSERFPFTDYAAVYWLAHFRQSCLYPRDPRSLSVVDVFRTERGRSSLLELASSLSVFISSPRAASAWFESFYTAESPWIVEDGRAEQYMDPPLRMLTTWLVWADALGALGNCTVSGTIIDTAQHFVRSTKDIIDTWGRRLRQSPSIVWDEMTGFCPSEFFFSPISVSMSIVSPEVPEEMRTLGDHLLLISHTSKNELRAVLRLWPSRCVIPNIQPDV